MTLGVKMPKRPQFESNWGPLLHLSLPLISCHLSAVCNKDTKILRLGREGEKLKETD